jgi:ABC-type uncharacterized transport system involved in gliding motility auxiliary subunit
LIYKIFIKLKLFLNKLTNIGLIGLVIGILVLVNYIISFLPLRLDLTENKIYSLSPSTKEIIGNLDDIVLIKLYFSKELPNKLLPIRREVESVLAEYERQGKGNIRIETVEPSGLEGEQEAASLGIPRLQFSGIEKDKLEVSQGFFGGVVQFAGEKETIPVFEEGGNFEYLFTSAINKLTRKKVPKVAFVTGHGEDPQSVQFARKLLERDFKVEQQLVSTASSKTVDIDKDIKTLLIINPKQSFKKEERDALEKFIDKGGSAIFAVEGIEVDKNLTTSPARHNLFSLFEKYGLKLNRDLVVSTSNEIANFKTAQNIFITQYPFWVRVRPEGVNKSLSALAQIKTGVFPWVSSIELDKASGVKNYKLLSSAPQSYSQESNFNLQPTQKFSIGEGTGEKVLAAAAENGQGGKIVLIGDADFISDSSFRQWRENAVLLLNLIDWITSGGKLSSIRSRESSFRPLAELNDAAQAGVKYAIVLMSPTILGIFGILRLLKRR